MHEKIVFDMMQGRLDWFLENQRNGFCSEHTTLQVPRSTALNWPPLPVEFVANRIRRLGGCKRLRDFITCTLR